MSKWYQIEAVKFITVVVEVEDNEGENQAYDVASMEHGPFDESEVFEIAPNNLDSAIRHADEVERL